MAVASGVGAQLGIKAETTWGTAVTPDTFLPFTSESITRQFEYIESKGLQAGILAQPQGLYVQTTESITGSVDLAVTTADHHPFFNMLHGNSVSPTTPGGGTNTRLQTHNIGATDPIGKSLTIQVGRPDVGGTVRPFTYSGCKVSSATWSMERGGTLNASYNVVGKTGVTATSLASASYSYGKPFNFTQGSIELDDVVLTDCVRSAQVTCTLPLATDRYCIGGGATIKEPVLTDYVAVEVQLECEFTSLTQYTAFAAAARRKLELNVTDTTAIEGSLYPYVYFTVASTVATAASPVVQGPDILTSTITLKGLSDGTNPLLKIEYQYDNTL